MKPSSWEGSHPLPGEPGRGGRTKNGEAGPGVMTAHRVTPLPIARDGPVVSGVERAGHCAVRRDRVGGHPLRFRGR